MEERLWQADKYKMEPPPSPDLICLFPNRAPPERGGIPIVFSIVGSLLMAVAFRVLNQLGTGLSIFIYGPIVLLSGLLALYSVNALIKGRMTPGARRWAFLIAAVIVCIHVGLLLAFVVHVARLPRSGGHPGGF